MPSLVFDNCCCCIELRTGCLIIGYLNLVGDIILTILAILGLVAGGVVAANGEDQSDKDGGVMIMVISVIFLLILLFFLAFTIVLLVGLHKNKRGHVKAYLIVSVICLVLSIIMFLASFAGTVTASDIVSKLISFALSIYFILVIRSYYYKMDDNKRPAIYNAA
ncbi:uncharacterized protein LOC126373225 [Pectinophora gossypiella]|uniref:MARVEL domain-containing protein n=1 Tax=Pectinophora gossypiella TaxID=13191 RepID=A0A1E1WV45_PECGO|nr:uncharacterized protein LOC126373225 [Pectinophora gossypiella]